MNIYIHLSFLICTAFLFSNCTKKKTTSDYIVVSIEPQRYFLEQIVRDKYEIETLIPVGVNPESYDPTPSQMILLNNSKLFFRLGYLGIEDVLLNKIKNKESLIVNCSDGVEIIDHECEDHHHPEGEIAHGHDAGDPHYWTSTTNARIILDNMLNGMISYDSVNADYYKENHKLAIGSIDSLENSIKESLKNSKSSAFIIYHPALTYYAKENNLKQFSIEHEGKAPSPRQLKNVVDSGMVNNVQVVFIQKEFDVKNAEIIASQLKADTCSIDLISYDWPATMMQITNKIAQ